MGAMVGKDGSVKVGDSALGYIDSWSLTPTIDTAEITAYGDTTKVNVQTLKSWAAEVSGTLNKVDAQQAALLDQFEDGTLSAVDLKLYTGASTYWQGSAVLTGGGITSTVGDKVSVNFSFSCAGDLSYT